MGQATLGQATFGTWTFDTWTFGTWTFGTWTFGTWRGCANGGVQGGVAPPGEALTGGFSPPPRMMMWPLGDQWIAKFEDLLGKTPNPGGFA